MQNAALTNASVSQYLRNQYYDYQPIQDNQMRSPVQSSSASGLYEVSSGYQPKQSQSHPKPTTLYPL